MAIKNFAEMVKHVKNLGVRRVAVAVAEDEEVLKAVRQAQDEGLTEAILIGDKIKIAAIALDNAISLDGMEIIDEKNPEQAAQTSCALIRDGKAAVIIKGLIDTSKLLKAILHKEKGLNQGRLLSHVTVFELPTYQKLLLLSDAAVNIRPTLEQKAMIIQNVVTVAHSLGISLPLVALTCAVEKVNAEAMPETAEAAILAKMNERGQIQGCIVDGPLGLDNAISEESARIKKIKSPVAGKADIIVTPDILTANHLYKSLLFLGNARAAAIVAGASVPIVLTSRADSHDTKYMSIVLGLVNTR